MERIQCQAKPTCERDQLVVNLLEKQEVDGRGGPGRSEQTHLYLRKRKVDVRRQSERIRPS